jgi:hypothetical protein
VDLRNYSGFCVGVKMLHWPDPYYVNASIHSSNTHALCEAVEDLDIMSQTVLKDLGMVRSSLVRIYVNTTLGVKDPW